MYQSPVSRCALSICTEHRFYDLSFSLFRYRYRDSIRLRGAKAESFFRLSVRVGGLGSEGRRPARASQSPLRIAHPFGPHQSAGLGSKTKKRETEGLKWEEKTERAAASRNDSGIISYWGTTKTNAIIGREIYSFNLSRAHTGVLAFSVYPRRLVPGPEPPGCFQRSRHTFFF